MHTESDFQERVQIQDDGCWHWTGAVMGGNVIGKRQPSAHYRGERMHARRAAWAYLHGDVPEGRLVASCGDRWCVSPHCATYADDLTDDDIMQAVNDRQPWENYSAVARRLGIRREVLSTRYNRIKRRTDGERSQ